MTASNAPFDFTTRIDRTGTGSLKWDRYPDAMPLWVADMDFRSPPAVLKALRATVDHGVFGYTVPYPTVETAVTDYLARVHQLDVSPDQLAWTPGMVPVLNLLCQGFAEPGDGVMTASPVYPPFLTAPKNQTRELQAIPLTEVDGQATFDFVRMEAEVHERTKVFILCNPHNPVGRVYTRDELERLADFCIRHDLILVSDEIHCDLVLNPDTPHISMASLGDEIAARTFTLMSPSKTYNIPGLATAYAIFPNPDLKRRLARATKDIFTEINIFGYAGCAAAYTHGEPWRQALLDVLRTNRDLVYAFMAEHHPEVGMRPMDATYLAWMDFRPWAEARGIERPWKHFLDRGIALSDGTPFGAPGFLRLNFGCPTAYLEEALGKMV